MAFERSRARLPPSPHARVAQRKGTGPTHRRRGFNSFRAHEGPVVQSGDRRLRTSETGVQLPSGPLHALPGGTGVGPPKSDRCGSTPQQSFRRAGAATAGTRDKSHQRCADPMPPPADPAPGLRCRVGEGSTPSGGECPYRNRRPISAGRTPVPQPPTDIRGANARSATPTDIRGASSTAHHQAV